MRSCLPLSIIQVFHIDAVSWALITPSVSALSAVGFRSGREISELAAIGRGPSPLQIVYGLGLSHLISFISQKVLDTPPVCPFWALIMAKGGRKRLAAPKRHHIRHVPWSTPTAQPITNGIRGVLLSAVSCSCD